MINKKYNQTVLKILSEVTSIVVAVLFALWANNWWADKQRNKDISVLLSAIKSELVENLSRMKTAHEHHTKQLTSIAEYRKEYKELDEDDYKSLNKQLFKKGIYQPAEIYITYWEILKDKGLLVDISNEQLGLLKPTYNSMIRYQETWQAISANSMNIALQAVTEKDKLMLTQQSIAQVWWLEKASILKIEEALNKLEFKSQ